MAAVTLGGAVAALSILEDGYIVDRQREGATRRH